MACQPACSRIVATQNVSRVWRLEGIRLAAELCRGLRDEWLRSITRAANPSGLTTGEAEGYAAEDSAVGFCARGPRP
jgi:hypothetical protein